jgi:tetratricopeptide (TPR) repeat protein
MNARTARTGTAVWLLCATLLVSGCGVPVVGRMGNLFGGGGHRQTRGEAITATEQNTMLDPSQPYWPYHLAELRLQGGEILLAEEALKTSLGRDAAYTPALTLLSKVYFEGSRHEAAVVLLESARARTGGWPEGFPTELAEGLALHYDALDRPDLAEAVMKGLPTKATLGHSPPVFLSLRGEAPDAAREPARAALQKGERSAVNYNNYGITQLRAGDPDGARKSFMRAMEINPDLPGPYYNLAILMKFYVFDDAAAAKWFRLYQERSPEDPDGLVEVFAAKTSGGKGSE